MIRAVILDWGGVIQRTEDPAPRGDLDKALGLPAGGTERAVFQSQVFERAMLGLVSAEACWNTIAAAVGWPLGQVDEFVERFFAGDRLDQALLRLIRWLRSQGLLVGLLSNAPPPRNSLSSAGRWGLEGLFDVQLFSYQVGVLKPDPRTYRHILDALQVAADEALFRGRCAGECRRRAGGRDGCRALCEHRAAAGGSRRLVACPYPHPKSCMILESSFAGDCSPSIGPSALHTV